MKERLSVFQLHDRRFQSSCGWAVGRLGGGAVGRLGKIVKGLGGEFRITDGMFAIRPAVSLPCTTNFD